MWGRINTSVLRSFAKYFPLLLHYLKTSSIFTSLSLLVLFLSPPTSFLCTLFPGSWTYPFLFCTFLTLKMISSCSPEERRAIGGWRAEKTGRLWQNVMKRGTQKQKRVETKKSVCGWRQKVADIDSKTERTTCRLKGLPRFYFLSGIKAILCAIQLRYFVRLIS